MMGAHVKYRMALALIGATFAASAAYARDTIRDYPIDSALKSEEGKLDDGVALYFGDQPHPRVMKSYGTFATNKKTNAFGKSDEAACQHVFLSAVIELQARARARRAAMRWSASRAITATCRAPARASTRAVPARWLPARR